MRCGVEAGPPDGFGRPSEQRAPAQTRDGARAPALRLCTDEQVCRNGVTWRYATIRPLEDLDPMTGQPSPTATGTPVPVRLYDVLSSAYAGGPVEQTPAVRLTGPDGL